MHEAPLPHRPWPCAPFRCVDRRGWPPSNASARRGSGWLLDSACATPPGPRSPSCGAAALLPSLRIRGTALRARGAARRATHEFAVGGTRLRGGSAGTHAGGSCRTSAGSGRAVQAFRSAARAVGYLGYELAEQLDVHRLHGRDDLGLPDAVLLLVDRLLAFDHDTGSRVAPAGSSRARRRGRTGPRACGADRRRARASRSPQRRDRRLSRRAPARAAGSRRGDRRELPTPRPWTG